MKKFVLAALVLLSGPFAYAGILGEVAEQSGQYLFSSLTVGYYDHFHGGRGEEVAKEKNLLVSVPALAYDGYAADVFATFESREIQEWGARFNLTPLSEYGFLKYFRIEPYVFKNEAIDSVGFGIFTQVRLR